MDGSAFRELVSGRRRGGLAVLLRAALRVLEVPYTGAVRWRNRAYDRGYRQIERVAVPVISVGNLTLGGTGKTPMVAWLARWFRAHGIRLTLISRGYAAKAGSVNDEARELEQQLPDVPHLQNPNRVEAARTAIQEYDSKLILLDDAFQHRRIARDLDVVLIDALEPFGFDHVFPRGTLREPAVGLRRADVVVLTRANLADESRRKRIQRRARKIAPAAVWVEVAHEPRALISADGNEASVETLAERTIAAFCGIGNPEGFAHTLESCGYAVAGMREFPDHHQYDRADIDSIAAWLDTLAGVEAVVCTHKDLVKIGVNRIESTPLWALAIEMELLAGENPFVEKLEGIRHSANRR